MSWMRTDRWRARTILPLPLPQGEGEKVAGPAP